MAYDLVDYPDWRAQFDLVADGRDPVNLKLYLRHGQTALTETWLYQHLPVPSA